MAPPRVTSYTPFVFDEIRRIGRAWLAQNPQAEPVDVEFLFEKIGEMAWRRLVDEKSLRQIFQEIGVNPDDYLPAAPEPTPLPVEPRPLAPRPWVGIEITGLVLNPRHNLHEIVARYRDAGVTLTRINLLATSWTNPDNVMPFHWPGGALGEHKWDLFNWRTEHFERIDLVRELFNSQGITVEWPFLELYSWSKRKDFDKRFSPWRYNTNGMLWGGDLTQAGDDDTLRRILPDEWCRQYVQRAAPLCGLDRNLWLIGNELPEKSLHVKIRDLVRSVVPGAQISVNRNEDTPGQYRNHDIGEDFDFLEHHGIDSMADLEKDWGPDYGHRSYVTLLEDPRVDPSRIIFNSDGCRRDTLDAAGRVVFSKNDPVNPYRWDQLREVFRYVRSKGASILHQSRAKLTEEPNHHMIEVDWFTSVIA